MAGHHPGGADRVWRSVLTVRGRRFTRLDRCGLLLATPTQAAPAAAVRTGRRRDGACPVTTWRCAGRTTTWCRSSNSSRDRSRRRSSSPGTQLHRRRGRHPARRGPARPRTAPIWRPTSSRPATGSVRRRRPASSRSTSRSSARTRRRPTVGRGSCCAPIRRRRASLRCDASDGVAGSGPVPGGLHDAHRRSSGQQGHRRPVRPQLRRLRPRDRDQLRTRDVVDDQGPQHLHRRVHRAGRARRLVVGARRPHDHPGPGRARARRRRRRCC